MGSRSRPGDGGFEVMTVSMMSWIGYKSRAHDVKVGIRNNQEGGAGQ